MQHCQARQGCLQAAQSTAQCALVPWWQQSNLTDFESSNNPTCCTRNTCKQNETRVFLQFHPIFFFWVGGFKFSRDLKKQPETSRCTIPKRVHSPATGPTWRSYILPPEGYGVDLGTKLGNIELQFLRKWSRNKNSHLQKVVSLQSVRFCWLKDVTYIIHFWHGWSCRSALVALHHSGEGGATWAFWWGNGRLKPSPVLTTWNPRNTSSRIYILLFVYQSLNSGSVSSSISFCV